VNDFEARLTGRMYDVAEAEAGGTPPTQHLLTRGRQARLRRRAVLTGGLAAVVVAAGVVTSVVPWSTPEPPPVAEQAPTPAVRLAAAVAASDDISYRVKVTWSGPGGIMQVTEGAFDPATRTGYLNSGVPGVEVAYYERLIDGTRFVGSSGSRDKWKQYPGTHDRLAYDSALDSAASASADPKALFDLLVAAGAVITQNDAGFHFEVSPDQGHKLVGDVVLGADNRIATVTYDEAWHIEKNGDVETSTSSMTIQLSDYGTPVQVERPVDIVVVQK
jgi:hypothetical protein